MNGSNSPHKYSRREFLLRAGGSTFVFLVPSAFLSACAGDTEQRTATSPSTTLAGPLSSLVGPVELNFLGWQGYDGLPAAEFPAFTAWRDDNEVSVSSTYVSDNPEILTKLQTAPTGTYDLATPFHGIAPTMIAAGVLGPITVDQIPNYGSIYELFRGLEALKGQDGEVYAVPFTFSQDVAIYNADNVDPLERYAQIFEDPSLHGRYALVDLPSQLTWVARHLGLGNPDPHHLTVDELTQVRDRAREAIANARTMAGSLGDLLQLIITEEVDWAWYGTADMIATAQAEGVNAKTFLPEEGNQAFVDAYAIPKGSQHLDASLALINEALSPEVQAELANVYGGGVVNPSAVDHLSDELGALYDYANLDVLFDRIQILPPVPVESDDYATYSDWVQAWNEAKL